MRVCDGEEVWPDADELGYALDGADRVENDRPVSRVGEPVLEIDEERSRAFDIDESRRPLDVAERPARTERTAYGCG